tara:strand:- start:3431 stop:3637 length:207 start_codon:yes stop_codon:yes gene_type:complete
MNDALTRISVLLLIFYMAWYMWDQNELIKSQAQYIESLQIQSLYDTITIQQLRAQQDLPFYQKNDNPI